MESGALYSHNPVLSVQAELDALERRWRRRLDMQQREAAKKAAASAAAATAAASCRTHFHAPPSNQSATVSATHTVAIPQETIVAQTASWLDRANAILASGGEGEPIPRQQLMTDGISGHAQAVSSEPARAIENEMIEVQRLIHEGPIIQQTTAGLPRLLDHSLGSDIAPQYTTSLSGDHESLQPPVDKRPRRLSGNDSSGAEDAQALVGFLNSVRAAAAADRPSVS